jgi:hypothetical protein
MFLPSLILADLNKFDKSKLAKAPMPMMTAAIIIC